MKTNPVNKLLNEELDLKGGVLIIGSLLWQDHGKGENDRNSRKKWRDEHLLMDKKVAVCVPIRYGRYSESNIYTMVFSNSCAKNKQGTGFFVPFKQASFSTFDELIKEAEALSDAEGMHGDLLSTKKSSGDVWCVLGLLTNPQTVGKELEKALSTKWSTIIRSKGDFNTQDFKIGREKSCLTKLGQLNINWPSVLDPEEAEFLNSHDFIIAAGIQPTHYPSVKELVTNVKADKTRKYFIQNYKAGITTFQDIAVINKL